MADEAPGKAAKTTDEDFLRMTAHLVAAYLRKNSVPAAQITTRPLSRCRMARRRM